MTERRSQWLTVASLPRSFFTQPDKEPNNHMLLRNDDKSQKNNAGACNGAYQMFIIRSV